VFILIFVFPLLSYFGRPNKAARVGAVEPRRQRGPRPPLGPIGIPEGNTPALP
jgi:hypothetical protein